VAIKLMADEAAFLRELYARACLEEAAETDAGAAPVACPVLLSSRDGPEVAVAAAVHAARRGLPNHQHMLVMPAGERLTTHTLRILCWLFLYPVPQARHKGRQSIFKTPFS
jgi:hypothetical protein